MFLTVAIIASATFLLPFLSLVNKDYIPDFLLTLSNHISGYLPEALHVNVEDTLHKLPENVSATDNIIKPTESSHTALLKELVLNTTKPLDVHVKDVKPLVGYEFNIVDYLPDSVHTFILNHNYIIRGVQEFNWLVNSAIDKSKQFSDSLFFNNYVYPHYQLGRLLASQNYLRVREHTNELLEKYYYTLSPDDQERAQSLALAASVLVVLLLLSPLIKFLFRLLIKDAKEYHDSSKKQFKPPKGSSPQNGNIAKDSQDEYHTGKKIADDVAKTATAKYSRKNRKLKQQGKVGEIHKDEEDVDAKQKAKENSKDNSKKSTTDEDSKSTVGSLYDAINDTFAKIPRVNDDVLSSFKNDVQKGYEESKSKLVDNKEDSSKNGKADSSARSSDNSSAEPARTIQYEPKKEIEEQEEKPPAKSLSAISLEHLAEIVNNSHVDLKKSWGNFADIPEQYPLDYKTSDSEHARSTFDSDGHLTTSSHDFDHHSDNSHPVKYNVPRVESFIKQPIPMIDHIIQSAITKEIEIETNATVTKDSETKIIKEANGDETFIQREGEKKEAEAEIPETPLLTVTKEDAAEDADDEQPTRKPRSRKVSVSEEHDVEHKLVTGKSNNSDKKEPVRIEKIETKRQVTEFQTGPPRNQDSSDSETETEDEKENFSIENKGTIHVSTPEKQTIKPFDESSNMKSGSTDVSKVQLIPATDGSLTEVIHETKNSTMISPSKLIYQSLINTTSGVSNNNVYSSIILPQSQSPTKQSTKSRTGSRSSFKENLDSIQFDRKSSVADTSNSSVE